MKSAIIVVLILALLGGAMLSKPSEDDFKQMIATRVTASDVNVLQAGLDKVRADEFVNACTFNNRIFWMNVQKDGRTIYTGAFGRWISRADISKDMTMIKGDANVVKEQVKSIKIGN